MGRSSPPFRSVELKKLPVVDTSFPVFCFSSQYDDAEEWSVESDDSGPPPPAATSLRADGGDDGGQAALTRHDTFDATFEQTCSEATEAAREGAAAEAGGRRVRLSRRSSGLLPGACDDIAGEIRETLMSHIELSFYSRTVTRCVFADNMAELACLWTFAVFLAFLQTWSLQTVHQYLWYVKYGTLKQENTNDEGWLEEYGFPFGVPGPIDYIGGMDDTAIEAGLPIFIIAPLCFTMLMLGKAVQKGASGMKSAYLVLRDGLRRQLRDPTARGSVGLALGFSLHMARFVMTVYFAMVTIMIVGTADGPFNLLLNSLAMFFVLESDDIIDIDVPTSGYFGALRPCVWERHAAWRRKLRDIADGVASSVVLKAQGNVHGVLHAFVEQALCPIIALLMLWPAWTMQRHTARGHAVTPDDDTFGDAPNVARVYEIATRLILLVLLVDKHWAWVLASDTPSFKAAAGKVACFAFELTLCVVGLVIGVEWGINVLLCWNKSAETRPLHFWDKLTLRHDRPETFAEYYYYAPGDDGGDATGYYDGE